MPFSFLHHAQIRCTERRYETRTGESGKRRREIYLPTGLRESLQRIPRLEFPFSKTEREKNDSFVLGTRKTGAENRIRSSNTNDIPRNRYALFAWLVSQKKKIYERL